MMKSGLRILAVIAMVFAVVPMTHAEDSWSGEVLDLDCYVGRGAMGEGHAGCAKSCIKGGQPMGLLTEDGTVMLLASSRKDGEPYEALKDWAGQMVEVSGELAERNGVKVLTVTSAKASG
jgi:hypothetical protein